MKIALRWIRLLISSCLFVLLVFLSFYHNTVVYLVYQAKGQFSILFNTQEITEYSKHKDLSLTERSNISLIDQIKQYSIDSLDYKATDNFTTVYDQKSAPILWVITVSNPYEIKAYEWSFPVVGRVSYKGFFNKDLALAEYNHFVAQGYDVDMRSVSAWSTLGWFKDPILSNMLKGRKGALCNLLFHELFHATYYAPNSVNFNENIASFVAHKATIQFLSGDTVSLSQYLYRHNERKLYNNFILRQRSFLEKRYVEIAGEKNRYLLKLKAINDVVDSLALLKTIDPRLFEIRKKEILEQKNAYFIDFEQYDSMQDSLEGVFNKIYKGNLKKMVQDLKQKGSNY